MTSIVLSLFTVLTISLWATTPNDIRQCEQGFNEANVVVYDARGPKGIDELVTAAGLKDSPDVQLLAERIRNARRIGEVGAGNGRVIKAAQSINPKANFTAIEAAASNAEALRNDPDLADVQVLGNKLQDVQLEEPLDLLLWMFSGFADLNEDEQPVALAKAVSLLRSGGTFVIDLPDSSKKTNATARGGKYLEVNRPEGTIRGYLPQEEELLENAARAGLKFSARTSYDLLGGDGSSRSRFQYVFKKP